MVKPNYAAKAKAALAQQDFIDEFQQRNEWEQLLVDTIGSSEFVGKRNEFAAMFEKVAISAFNIVQQDMVAASQANKKVARLQAQLMDMTATSMRQVTALKHKLKQDGEADPGDMDKDELMLYFDGTRYVDDATSELIMLIVKDKTAAHIASLKQIALGKDPTDHTGTGSNPGDLQKIVELQRDIKELKNVIEEKDSEIAEIQHEQDLLKERVEGLNSDVSEANTVARNAADSATHAKEDLVMSQDAWKELQKEYQTLHKQHEDMKRLNGDGFEKLLKENVDLSGVNGKQSDKIAEQEKAIGLAWEENSTMTNALEHATKEAEAAAFREIETEQRKQGEINQVQLKLDTQTRFAELKVAELEELKSFFAEFETKYNAAMDKIEKHEETIEKQEKRYHGAVNSMNGEANKLNIQIEQLKDAGEKAVAALEAVANERDEVIETLNEAQVREQNMLIQIEELLECKGGLESMVQQLQLAMEELHRRMKKLMKSGGGMGLSDEVNEMMKQAGLSEFADAKTPVKVWQRLFKDALRRQTKDRLKDQGKALSKPDEIRKWFPTVALHNIDGGLIRVMALSQQASRKDRSDMPPWRGGRSGRLDLSLSSPSRRDENAYDPRQGKIFKKRAGMAKNMMLDNGFNDLIVGPGSEYVSPDKRPFFDQLEQNPDKKMFNAAIQKGFRALHERPERIADVVFPTHETLTDGVITAAVCYGEINRVQAHHSEWPESRSPVDRKNKKPIDHLSLPPIQGKNKETRIREYEKMNLSGVEMGVGWPKLPPIEDAINKINNSTF